VPTSAPRRSSSSSIGPVRPELAQRLLFIDSKEGCWNSGREENPNLGYKPRYKEGYFPVPPTDSLQDIRSEMMLTLEDIGVQMEAQHHEVATGGQCELDMRFASLVDMGDQLLKFKYIIKNVARKYNKTVTFMPKPSMAITAAACMCTCHLEGRQEPVRRRRLRGHVADGDCTQSAAC